MKYPGTHRQRRSSHEDLCPLIPKFYDLASPTYRLVDPTHSRPQCMRSLHDVCQDFFLQLPLLELRCVCVCVYVCVRTHTHMWCVQCDNTCLFGHFLKNTTWLLVRQEVFDLWHSDRKQTRTQTPNPSL